MNDYFELVQRAADLIDEGKSLPFGGVAPLPAPEISPDAPVALIFSPHPDDECIIGGLPLRWMRSHGWRVINVAVTQGSNPDRQSARWAELEGACRYLGFELIETIPNGLEKVNLKTRDTDPDHWNSGVKVIADILSRYAPRAILFPHDDDWNSTHIGVHWMVLDALRSLGNDFQTHAVETEFWGAMASPNLTVESSFEELGQLLTALSFHEGEVRRNPYHLLTPAWMQDNVRRGGELVGGQGEAAPTFRFATLYRHRVWRHGAFAEIHDKGRMLASTEDAAALFGGLE